MKIDELEPYVIHKGESYIYLNKKGQMYKIRPLNRSSEGTWVHVSELTQDTERNMQMAKEVFNV